MLKMRCDFFGIHEATKTFAWPIELLATLSMSMSAMVIDPEAFWQRTSNGLKNAGLSN
jgi:hypothetical protein